MATSSSAKGSAATICARAAPDAGFKRCCLASERYDGSLRNHFFQAEALSAAGIVPSDETGKPTHFVSSRRLPSG
jgi:hypothetical protein